MKQAHKHAACYIHLTLVVRKTYKASKGNCLVLKKELNEKGKYILLF